jgi:hypothetical protein
MNRSPVPRRRPGSTTPFRGAAAALGLVTVALPLAWAPGWAYAVASAAAAGVLAAAFAGWRRGPVLAVAAAVVACAFSRAGTAVLAAEGLFIVAYLIVADAPAGLSPKARPGSWLRQQVPGGVAGLVGSGAVLTALALHRVSPAWLAAAGLAAAAVAYLIALPSKQAAARASGRDSDVDVQ